MYIIYYREYGRLSDIIICHTCRNSLIGYTYLLSSGNTVIDAVGFFESPIKKNIYKNKNLLIIINTGATMANLRPEFIYL